MTEQIPYGYCHCGCGQKAPLATQNHNIKGYKKGEPVNFLQGHFARTKMSPQNLTHKKCSECTKRKPLEEYYKEGGASSGTRSKCKACEANRNSKEKIAATYQKNKLVKWVTDIYRWYGITPYEYYEALEDQLGKCAICGGQQSDITQRRLCIDHYAKTGKFRGLLCGKCNKAIGLLNDSEELAENLLLYLKERND